MMMDVSLQVGSKAVLNFQDLRLLIDLLKKKGYRIAAPKMQDGAITYQQIHRVEELPLGFGDDQSPGRYRLCYHKNSDEVFGYVVGADSWKKFLYPPNLKLWSATRSKAALSIHEGEEPDIRWAFLGVRPCELSAIDVQDKVFLHGDYRDRYYESVRENLFLVAVQCGKPADTCFCSSMGTGPRAETGFDLALTEVLQAEDHYFLVEVGSEAGLRVAEGLPLRRAEEPDIEAALKVSQEAEQQIRRSLDTEDIRGLLSRQFQSPRWAETAARCLACTNCTQVCPTCFCSTIEDRTDLKGESAERWRKWDSCFTGEFSYIHGGTIRASVESRYRQWLCHKLSYWLDQFGTSGCVGCGRCITWCPVGIDLTEEIRVIREIDSSQTNPTPEEEKVHAND